MNGNWLTNRARAVMAAGLVPLILAGTGCHRETARSAPVSASPAGSLIFRAQELPFVYDRGETGDAWPVETTGGGVGLLDYDGDGRLDLFFAQGVPLRPGKDSHLASDVLLRNLGDGRFEDVSARVGLIRKEVTARGSRSATMMATAIPTST